MKISDRQKVGMKFNRHETIGPEKLALVLVWI